MHFVEPDLSAMADLGFGKQAASSIWPRVSPAYLQDRVVDGSRRSCDPNRACSVSLAGRDQEALDWRTGFGSAVIGWVMDP